MRDLLAFTVPAGLITAAAIIAGYLTVRGPLDGDVIDGRTAAVMIATAMGLAVVVVLERGPGEGVRWWVWAMVGAFALCFTLGLLAPPLREFFEVSLPTRDVWLATVLIAAAGIALLWAVLGRPRRSA